MYTHIKPLGNTNKLDVANAMVLTSHSILIERSQSLTMTVV